MRSRALALSLSLAWALGTPPTAADPPAAAAVDPDSLAVLQAGHAEPESPPPDGEAPETAVPPPLGARVAQPPPKHGRQAAIDEAAESYRLTGAAPVVWRPGGVVFPFGESQPIVTCSPLRACDIELQEGEVIRDVALGDIERWVAKPLMSGEVDRTVPHVVIKPRDYGLATNLVIGTTRRTYHLALVSPAETATQGQVGYDRYVSFYYPQDLVESWATEEQLRRQEARRQESAMPTEILAAFSVDDLNFDYRIEPDRKVTWAPQTVFDDGEHVYIQLPASVRSSDLPALLVEVEGGGLAVSNYRVQGLWYVVDGLFKKAELVVGVGKARKKVALRNLRWPSGG